MAKAYVVRGGGRARLRVTERRVRSPQQRVSESDVLSAARGAVDAGRVHVHGIERRDESGWDYIVAVPLGREEGERAARSLPGATAPDGPPSASFEVAPGTVRFWVRSSADPADGPSPHAGELVLRPGEERDVLVSLER